MCFSRPGVATAVFIFLTSDGPGLRQHQRPTVTVHLTDVSGNNHSLGESDSDPFGVTRGWSSRPWSQLGVCLWYCLGPCLQYAAIEKIQGMLDVGRWSIWMAYSIFHLLISLQEPMSCHAGITRWLSTWPILWMSSPTVPPQCCWISHPHWWASQRWL